MSNSDLNDFRIGFYNKYRSAFNNYISPKGEKTLQSEFKGFQKKYFKLFSHYSKHSRILDVGCGSGNFMEFLKQCGYNEVYGFDLSVEQCNYARSRGLNVDVSNIFDFVKKSEHKYQIIFAMDIIEHFYKNELTELFEGLYSLLTDDGILIIRTPNGDSIFSQHIIYGDLTHLTIFNPNSLSQILRLVGFKEIIFLETGPTTKSLISIVRLFLWKIIRVIIKAIRIIETGGSERILTQEFICTAKKNPNN